MMRPMPGGMIGVITAEQAVRDERITLAQRQTLLESFSASLRGYTYYED